MGGTSPIIVKIGQVTTGKESNPGEAPEKMEAAPAPDFQALQKELQQGSSVRYLSRQYPARLPEAKTYHQRNYRRHRDRHGSAPAAPENSGWWWSLPTALGIGVGLILGIALLLFVKTVSFSNSSDGLAVNATDPSQAASIELPGYSVWFYQVGSFTDQSSADRRSAELKSGGIYVAARGTNPIQLVAGVASSKVSSSLLIDVLKKKSVDFYLKQVNVDAQTITVSGITQGDASNMKSELDEMLGGVKTDIASVDSSTPAGSSPSAAHLPGNTEVQLLQRAGHAQAAADLQILADKYQAVQNALKTNQKLDEAAALAAEQHLAEFYAEYDRLVQDLQRTSK